MDTVNQATHNSITLLELLAVTPMAGTTGH